MLFGKIAISRRADGLIGSVRGREESEVSQVFFSLSRESAIKEQF